MITIEYEIKKRSKFTEIFHKLKSRLEDIFLNILVGISKRWNPQFLQNWITRYTNKKVKELQQQITRQKWQKITLESAVNEIHNRQQDNE